MSGVGGTQGGSEDPVDRFIDVNKHMTTLGSGALVLIATFMKDIFPKTEDGTLDLHRPDSFLLGTALLAFALAVLTAVSLLVYMTAWTSPNKRALGWFTALSVYNFFWGVAMFGLVVYRTVVLT